MSASKRLRRESSSEEDPVIRDKLDDLKTTADLVTKKSADRLSLLEQAAPLAAHFHETHSDLLKWFDEMEAEVRQLEAPALNAEQIKQQQDDVKVSHWNVWKFCQVLAVGRWFPPGTPVSSISKTFHHHQDISLP